MLRDNLTIKWKNYTLNIPWENCSKSSGTTFQTINRSNSMYVRKWPARLLASSKRPLKCSILTKLLPNIAPCGTLCLCLQYFEKLRMEHLLQLIVIVGVAHQIVFAEMLAYSAHQNDQFLTIGNVKTLQKKRKQIDERYVLQLNRQVVGNRYQTAFVRIIYII